MKTTFNSIRAGSFFGLNFLLVIVFLSFSSIKAIGQNPLDSLIQVLESNPPVKERLKILFDLTRRTAFKDKEASKAYALEYDSIATDLDDPDYQNKAKQLLGRVHFAAQEFELAAKDFLEAFKISEEKRDTPQIAVNANNLSAVFWTQSDTLNAIKFSRKAVEYYGYTGNKKKMALGSANLGSIYNDMQRYDSAQVYLQKAITNYKLLNDEQGLQRPYYILSKTMVKKGKLKEALKYINLSIAALPKGEKPFETADAFMYKGHILGQLGRFKEGKAALNISEGFIKENNLKESERNIPFYWAALYEKEGNYKQALEYERLYVERNQKASNQERDVRINELLTKYGTEKKEAEIATLSLQDQLNESRISQQRYLIFGLLIGVGLLAFLFYRNYQQRKKIESQNAIITKALKEKDTLLREIHHRVKNNLQLVSSLLGLQSRYIQDRTALDALNSGKARVKSMALIHQDLYNKESLTGVSARDYIQKLGRELLATYQIDTDRIELHTDISDMVLDVDTLVPLGLIINELLTNSLKYAFPDGRPGRIDISLKESNGKLQLDFSDNGVGVDESKLTPSSFGYKLIDTLLSQLEGEMRKINQDGTHLYFTFEEYKIAA